MRDLTICPDCSRDFVVPVAWHEIGFTHWAIALACQNCGRMEAATVDNATAEAFDTKLDRGIEAIERDLRVVERRRFEDETDRFAAALRDDAILPEDF